ncbi:hypothetical protein LTR91_003985 [Friedmanniomyces endolithicus]|uniref:Homeobox domain-containing protein n=1 Tax=Friedmanniomyces endolithicus TaxID=329885 RepID=A0AAN6KYA2_9PEZI|nr:hypothetical protein LTS01_016714 [Friedmanniomyces endolithicus]KAK1005564.1 hypothetical protein LTR91_003985 [Friedmanniomyces endolithicus]KAK1045361.1 hypothetical protein LTS16_006605 [Friedmanniomyces endolithicus]
MPEPRKGFERRVARALRRSRAQPGVTSRAISRSIEDFTDAVDADDLLDENTDSDSDSVSSTTFDRTVFSRRVLLRNHHQVSENAMLSLNELLEVEGDFLEYAQAEILKTYFEKRDIRSGSDNTTASSPQNTAKSQSSANEDLLVLLGLQQNIRQKIDRVTYGAGTTAHQANASISNSIPRCADTLLADFFAICKFPNGAELRMLTVACRLPSEQLTVQWFNTKRSESRHWATARAVIHDKLTRPDGEDEAHGLKQ